jgi:hypothetical protein
MKQRTATAPLRTANDDVIAPPAAAAPLSWLAVICALLLLTAFAGAFLVGLVVVGLLAPVICGIDLLRRRLLRPAGRLALLTAK